MVPGRWIALALMLVLPAVAGQVAIQSDFSSSGSTTFHGTSDLRWEAAVVSIRPGENATDVWLDAGTAEVRIINRPLHMVSYRNPLTGESRNASMQGVEHETFLATVHGLIHLHLHAEYGEVRVVRDGESFQTQTTTGVVEMGPAGSRLHDQRRTPFGHAGEYGGVPTSPFSYTAAQVGMVERHDFERVVVAATGATVTLPDGTSRFVGSRPNETLTATDPATGTGHSAFDNLVLLIEAPRVAVEAPGTDWTVGARAVRGQVEGAGSWRGLHGDLRVEGDRAASDPSLLEMEGRFLLDGRLDDDAGAWTLEGTATGIRVDTEPLLNTTVGLAGVGTLAALLALLAAGKGLATFLLGRATPATLRAGALDNRNRCRIVAVLLKQQPLRLPDLQDRTGLARSSLRYHLRILESSGLVRRHVGGPRNATYAVAIGDAPPGLHVAHGHPLRRALYERILDGSATTVAELEAAVVADGVTTGLPASTAAFHLKKLVDAGLVRATWNNGRKYYAARNLRPTVHRSAPSTAEPSIRVIHAIRRTGPTSREELLAAVSAAGLRRRTSRRHLDRMHEAGFLTIGPDGAVRPSASLGLLAPPEAMA